MSQTSPIKNRIRSYFAEKPLEIRSPLTPDESVKRLSSAVGSPFNFLQFEEGLVGRVEDGRISVSYRRPPLRNSFKPVLTAQIEATEDGCVVRGTYGLHAFAWVFMIVWCGMALLFAGVTTMLAITEGDMIEALIFVSGIVAMLAFGVGLTWFGMWMGRSDVGDIEARLRALLEAE
jgi:hypothetical protein